MSLVMIQKDFIKLNYCHDHEIRNSKDILFILALGKRQGKNTIGAILLILHGRLICKQHVQKNSNNCFDTVKQSTRIVVS